MQYFLSSNQRQYHCVSQCQYYCFCTSLYQNRLPIADIKWLIQHYTITSPARAWANQLPGCITRIIRIFTWTFATMFDYRIKNFSVISRNQICDRGRKGERKREIERVRKACNQPLISNTPMTTTITDIRHIAVQNNSVQFYWILPNQNWLQNSSKKVYTKNDVDIYHSYSSLIFNSKFEFNIDIQLINFNEMWAKKKKKKKKKLGKSI